MSGFTQINVGTTANDGTGDSLRVSQQAVNSNLLTTVRTLSAVSDLATEAAASGYSRIVQGFGDLRASNTSDTVNNIDTFASGSVGWQWKKSIKGVLYGGDYLVADGSTDNTDALDDLIQWCLTNNYKLLLPPGQINYTSLTAIGSGMQIEGQGGNTSGTILFCTNTSGPALRITGRSNALKGFAIASSAERLAATVTDGHGIHVEGPDISGTVSLSRNYFEDLYIYHQPLDGVHVAGLWEMSGMQRVTVADCLRHGFAFDDGTRSGRTNKGGRPFVYHMRQCRAFECAGNGFLFGNASQTSVPYGLFAEQIESLGCGWNTGVTEFAEQIYVRTQQSLFINPDVEDQQYAESATSSTGMAKTARATPSKGFRVATSNVEIRHPYFSSLVQSIICSASISSIAISYPVIFVGEYGVAQADAIEVPSSLTSLKFEGETQAGATNLIKNQSTKGELWIDGVRYIPTTSSVMNIKAPEVAEDFTISSGTLTAACNLIKVRGEGSLADTMVNFRFVSGVNGYVGNQVTLIYGGEEITIFHGAGNLVTSTGEDVLLNAYNPSVTLTCYDGSNWFVEKGTSSLISVKSFGATGDGSTDDTTAIQAAIDFCEGAKGSFSYEYGNDLADCGYKLFFPRGVYITQKLTWKTGVYCLGVGSGSVIKLNDSTDDGVILIQDIDNFGF